MDGGHPTDRGLVEDTSKHGVRIETIESVLATQLGKIELRLEKVEKITGSLETGLGLARILVILSIAGSLLVMAAFAMMDRL